MKTYDKIKLMKNNILNEQLIIKYRKDRKYFTRKRKIKYEDIIYFTLNKRGMSLNMELNKYENQTGRMKKVSKSALCQQRKKIAPELFKELNSEYIKNSYDNKEDYKTLKGYIVLAIDGMKIEVPNSDELKESYGVAKGKEGQRTSARALTSCLYDVINNWVIDAQIDKCNTSERNLVQRHIEEFVQTLKAEIDIKKTIILFDRGYPSLEMIHLLNRNKIKYLFRMDSTKYHKEVTNMQTNDEEIHIEITRKRLEKIVDKQIKEELKKEKEIVSRVVKYPLDTGEIEILLTNIEKTEFNTEEIGPLYFRRWNVEIAYNIAKNRLDIQNFSGESKIVVEQEFYAQMLMLNIAEDLRKEANKEVNKTKDNGYKYDYKINMNSLIGLLRENFIVILINMAVKRDEKSKKEYDEFIDKISENIIPIRANRKNKRIKYKGYNKYKK